MRYYDFLRSKKSKHSFNLLLHSQYVTQTQLLTNAIQHLGISSDCTIRQVYQNLIVISIGNDLFMNANNMQREIPLNELEVNGKKILCVFYKLRI